MSLQFGVDLGGEKSDEEVEEVDSQAVGDDIEALDEVDPQHVDQGHRQRPHPPPHRVRRRPIQIVLECSGELVSPLAQRHRRTLARLSEARRPASFHDRPVSDLAGEEGPDSRGIPIDYARFSSRVNEGGNLFGPFFVIELLFTDSRATQPRRQLA